MADRLPMHRLPRPPLPKQEVRPSSNERGYDATWQKLRLMILRGEPLCRRCGEAASQVDHIVPLRKGGTNAQENLQSLCHSCHSRKTITEDM